MGSLALLLRCSRALLGAVETFASRNSRKRFLGVIVPDAVGFHSFAFSRASFWAINARISSDMFRSFLDALNCVPLSVAGSHGSSLLLDSVRDPIHTRVENKKSFRLR
jgi:hypothetical protein